MEMQVAASSSLFFTELVVIAAVIFGFCAVANAATDPNDVQGLQVLYTSLNSPSQLTSWKASGGDPCGESWKGVTCQGSSVVSVNISRNMLSQTVGDMFANHSALDTFQVQNNQLTGSLNVLVGLPLTNLNVANNHFTGWIPQELTSITNFVYDGNAFANGPAPPPPPYTSPPPGRPRNHSRQIPPGGHKPDSNRSNSQNENKNGLTAGPIVGIVLGSLFAAVLLLLALVFCLRRGNKKEIAARPSTGSLPVSSEKVNMEMQEQRSKPTASVSDLKPPPADNLTVERLQGKNGSVKRVKSPITATSYTVAALQTATNSFSQENLIGEGSLGRVYRADFPNGKIMALKKVDSAALSLQEEDNFLEAISNMSRLRHPNIVALAGYCVEHGQRLLVHDYIGNGSLHDMLHFADERSKMLTWNARVRVALGTARALEYLHEVCLPSVVHRNLKSANILLDEELNPHLSDCGLAALGPNTERQVSSTQMIGSFGYSAPEFALSGIYTVKSDVYSFGVVMLELLTDEAS
ncbi:protein STRUBBELIG-RECEPTOR FAMILY 8 [Sesamum angolense]|uniref:Protein STRUBBELIG-RECEPTOR FAMILY 8 n=1 Tax=Sesamum angolense TaxID=2727404 RepID=A0AAE2BIN0_9LAMI|nr:protein STRUBBELIG-RECEPTOR FAMILY 8 [Sesamum angolense]